MSRISDPEKLSQWQERLQRYRDCGQTIAQFCQTEKVSEPSFYGWKRRLAQPVSETRRKSQPTGSIKAGRSTALASLPSRVKHRSSLKSPSPLKSPSSLKHASPLKSPSPANAAFQRIELLARSTPAVATIRLPNGVELEVQRDGLTGDSLLESLFLLPTDSNFRGASERPC